MPRPLWQKLAAWALALALASGAAALAGADYEPGSCAPDALGLADRVRLAGASLAGLSLFLIATLHEGSSESAEAFAVAGGSASTAGAIAYTGLALVSSPAELSAVKALALVLFGAVGAASGELMHTVAGRRQQKSLPGQVECKCVRLTRRAAAQSSRLSWAASAPSRRWRAWIRTTPRRKTARSR
jgi:hypothetical protein